MDIECSLEVEERLPVRGYVVFGLWTLPNIRPRRCFEDQILHTNCAENLSSWSGSSPTRPRIHRLRLCYHHTLVTASFLFHEKTLFTKIFLSFRGRFREKLPSQKRLCWTLYFGGNDGALLSRLARLLTSPSPLKRLVLKLPIVFPPQPPPHFYCFPSTTTTTFLLFSLHNHHHISIVFPPPPPPHLYCFPSPTTSTLLLFSLHNHNHHISRIDESIIVNGGGEGGGGRTIEMWWCWKLVKLDKPPINSTWTYLYEIVLHFIYDTKTKGYDDVFLRKVMRFPRWKDNSTLFTSVPMLLNQHTTPSWHKKFLFQITLKNHLQCTCAKRRKK